MPPTSSETTPATAFQRISFSAGSWNTRPVVGQVRKLRLIAIAVPLFLHHVELARHRVMVDAAILVTDDRVGSRLGRRHRHDVLVPRMDLDVDVLRLQRKTVQPVHRREMYPVRLAFLE